MVVKRRHQPNVSIVIASIVALKLSLETCLLYNWFCALKVRNMYKSRYVDAYFRKWVMSSEQSFDHWSKNEIEINKEGPKGVALISPQMEAGLFNRGILGDKNPGTLLRTVYFLLCKHFGVRWSWEHREIVGGRHGQIRLVGPPNKQKVVCLYSDDEGQVDPQSIMGQIHLSKGANCPVQMKRTDISKAPKVATSFHWRANPSYEQGGGWYIEKLE